ncbi:hypothetical protein DYE50_09550 [Treponema ruminis]|uniref:Transposase n=2 Tax=Treponema ruminis TaxID=744515 RepID=A0A7W8G9K6_9SPIR|nr:hypothetical protein [Treponema ruminis]MBB5226285.1 hypothetical protein [Treponema ruminis]QSI02810.1 hypothetical protein DYE50_09550 [Treponema ruminis]
MNAKSSLCTISEDEINWARQNSIFKAQRDYNTGMHNAERRGYNKGVSAGMAAGERRNAIKNAKNALSMGLSPEQTAQITSLPLEQVLTLKEELEKQKETAVQ